MGKRGASGVGAPRPGRNSARRQRCKGCLLFFIKFGVYYYSVTMLCAIRSMWNWTYEPLSFQCRHEPLPANNSGLKVFVFAMMKTGTTTMTRTLLKFYRNVWHGEDLSMHLWAPLQDEYWQDPKNGGGMFPWQRLATPAPPARLAGSFTEDSYHKEPLPGFEHTPVRIVQRDMPRFREEVARRLSMCRVETLVFDGMENLLWDVYEISPDAKVIMLNWRTFREQQKSSQNFGPLVSLQLGLIGLISVGSHMLPYNALVLPIWDALTGNTLLHSMANGTPVASFRGAKSLLLTQSLLGRRFMMPFFSGMGMDFSTEKQYEEFWAEGKRRIPKERLFEFNMKKNTMRDLCDFLEIKDDPQCISERLSSNHTIFAQHEKDHPMDFLALWPYFFFCHWCGYTVLWLLLKLPLGVARALLLKAFPKKKGE